MEVAKAQNNKNKLKVGGLYDNKYNLVFTNPLGDVFSKRYLI